jgi:hypothetical protein
MPEVPAPVEPAFGEPTALPVPPDGPLAAPPALCACAPMGETKIAIAVIAAMTDVLAIENLLLEVTVVQQAGSRRNDFHRRPWTFAAAFQTVG